jgi:hypothetical protein
MGLTRDGVELHVSSFSGDAVAGGAVFLLVRDVDALHAKLVAKGVAIAALSPAVARRRRSANSPVMTSPIVSEVRPPGNRLQIQTGSSSRRERLNSAVQRPAALAGGGMLLRHGPLVAAGV